jgi:hypothetical protein
METELLAKQSVYGALPKNKVADYTSENNTNNGYVTMINKHGRQVPVPLERVQMCLGRGYVHTDNVTKSDDLALNIRKTTVRKKSEKAQLAEALTAVAEAVKPKEVKEKVDYSTMSFEELKAIGYVNLKKEGQARYKELKPTE